MPEKRTNDKTCVVVGASHAGVNLAFALRREGWEGAIVLFDADPELPYHRPPLSKAYLTGDEEIDKNRLKSEAIYKKEHIDLRLGTRVTDIDRENRRIVFGAVKNTDVEMGTGVVTDKGAETGMDADKNMGTDKNTGADRGRGANSGMAADTNTDRVQSYDKLVLATGARPIIPPIPGLATATNAFTMRTLQDSNAIRSAIEGNGRKRVVVIGGGYIGLETAASLRKLDAEVTVLEREERILARVTAPEMSAFFHKLHSENGVDVLTDKNAVSIETHPDGNEVVCSDGTRYKADMIVVGVGIQVNTQLAEKAGLRIENGIRVDATAKTDDDDIYAIGDCTFHHNPHYDRYVRLESVQNAVDQAKAAAANICGKVTIYNSLPWFWSDQYNVKLQMVGLSQGYDQAVTRKEEGAGPCMSTWYFKGDTLLAVDAVNNAKAYVYGTKFIKGGQNVDKRKLADPTTEFKPVNLLAE